METTMENSKKTMGTTVENNYNKTFETTMNKIMKTQWKLQ